MNQDWSTQLAALGARFAAGEVTDFGAPEAERQALSGSTTLHPLSDSLLAVEGDDAATFLQSQLTSDVLALLPARAQYSAYCTAKGRVLATLLVTRTLSGFLLQLTPGLAQAIAQRLRKYVLRAQVRIDDVSHASVMLGIGGPAAARLIGAMIPDPPVAPLDVASAGQARVWALEDSCFQLQLAPEQARKVWDRLAQAARPAGMSGWYWRRIQAGIPSVTGATQEQFVPQMIDLPRIGAVSFSKGCYPGQEIVARAQYRGEVKRRLFRGHVSADAAAGDPLFLAAPANQASGMVVNAACAPSGGTDLLAVVHVEALASGSLHLRTPEGVPVSLQPVDALHAAES